jgi:hypothetical protein
MEDVVTIKHAAKALGITKAALYLAIKQDRVQSLRVLDVVTIPRSEFNRLKRERIRRARRASSSQSNGNGHK